MTSFYARKLGALQGRTVLHSNDPSLQQANATDKWNHMHWNSTDNEAPSVSTAPPPYYPMLYDDDGKRAPDSDINAGYGPMAVPPHRRAGAPDARAHRPLEAMMEFGLYRVPMHDTLIYELAPDQSQYPTPNVGDLGRMIF